MLKALSRPLPSAIGVAALAAWAIALQQSLPRLLAGPICSVRTDSWAFAGHCPACPVAAALSLAFLASLVFARQQARRSPRAAMTA